MHINIIAVNISPIPRPGMATVSVTAIAKWAKAKIYRLH
jgi:hypothetical protein